MTVVAVAIPEPDCDNPDELRAWNQISIAEERHRDFSDPDTPDFYSVLAFAKQHAASPCKPFAWKRLAWDIRRRFDEDDARELIEAGVSTDSYSRFKATDERDATGEQIIIELDDATARSLHLEQVWHAAGVEDHADADPRPHCADEPLIGRMRPWQHDRDWHNSQKLKLAYTNPAPTGTTMPIPNLSIVPTAPLPDLIQSSGEFVQGFVPPDYLVDGILQRRFCYSMTAKTGVGKTTVAMLISALVATGRPLGGLEVAKGSVLYFAGENPTDIQMRWLGLTQEMQIDPATADVHFVPGAMPLSQVADRITAEVNRKGLQPALVVVDTAAAYFEGEDENSNTQAVEHARRLRSLTTLPGGPCVLILCHPTKRATDDDLIPRGGSAFIAEVDGNIALQKRDTLIVASVQGKFRGREFDPVSFELKAVRHPSLKDTKGRDIPTVVARTISESDKLTMVASNRRNEDAVLKVIHEMPGASLRALATTLGWIDGKGNPSAMKVSRSADVLAKEKLIQKHRGAWQCTQAGEKELNRLEVERNNNYSLNPTVTSPVTGLPPFPLPRTF